MYVCYYVDVCLLAAMACQLRCEERGRGRPRCLYMCVYTYICIYIYIYLHIHIHIHTHTHMFIAYTLYSAGCDIARADIQPAPWVQLDRDLASEGCNPLVHRRHPWKFDPKGPSFSRTDRMKVAECLGQPHPSIRRILVGGM